MNLRPTYLPPVKQNKRKRALLWLVVFLLGASTISYLWIKNQVKPDELVSSLPTICDYDSQETKEVLNQIPLENTQLFRDFFYYGETLSLLNEDYVVGEPDPFMGKQIRLENLCDNSIVSFLMSRTIDGNIPVEELNDGFYIASVEKDLVAHYLISDRFIHDVFYTTSRQGKSQKVELIADSDYFVDEAFNEKLFDKEILFVQVTTQALPTEIVDIMLDPAHMDQDFGPLDSGIQADDFKEIDVIYDLTLAIKEKLEKAGLKVGITRDRDEILNTYGQPSRLYRAFETQSKLMVEIDMVPNSAGFSVTATSYGGLSLPELIAQEIEMNTNLEIAEQRDRFGAFHDRRVNGLDYHNLIRESGGYSLGATLYSDISERLNQFAKDQRHGTQTIAINYGDVLNEDFRFLIEDEFELIVDASINGILQYLNIK